MTRRAPETVTMFVKVTDISPQPITMCVKVTEHDPEPITVHIRTVEPGDEAKLDLSVLRPYPCPCR